MDKWDTGLLGFCLGSFFGESGNSQLQSQIEQLKFALLQAINENNLYKLEIERLRADVKNLQDKLNFANLEIEYIKPYLPKFETLCR